MARTYFIAVAVLFLATEIVTAQPRLLVSNTMNEGVYLWIKSETRPTRDWQKWFIAKEGTFRVRLESPDRFHVVVEDQQGRRFSAGLLPLKAMIAQNPQGKLELGGVFAAEEIVSCEWSSKLRRWIWTRRTRESRTAVTFTLNVDENSYSWEAGRSE